MHLGWLQGELALEPLRPLPCTPRLDSSFRKLGLTPPPPPPQSSGLGAGCFTRSWPAPMVWVRLVARSVQQWWGDEAPFLAGQEGDAGAVWQGKVSCEPPQHGVMPGAGVQGGLCCGRGWQGGGGCRGWELSPGLYREVVGKLCASEGKKRRASKHPQPRGAFLHAPRSRVPEPRTGRGHPHCRSPRATLLLGSGLFGARSGGAGRGPHSPVSSGSGRSPQCFHRCHPGTGAQGRPPPRTR